MIKHEKRGLILSVLLVLSSIFLVYAQTVNSGNVVLNDSNSTGSLVSSDNLSVGDIFYLDDGRKARVTGIEDIVDKFNFDNLNFFANGVLVHNKDEGLAGFGPCDTCLYGPCGWNTGACGGIPNPRLDPKLQRNVIIRSTKNDQVLLDYAMEAAKKEGFSEKFQSLLETKFQGGRLPNEHDIPGTAGPIWEGGQLTSGGPRMYFLIKKIPKLDPETKVLKELGEIEVVAYSAKCNQQKVINRLRFLYPKK